MPAGNPPLPGRVISLRPSTKSSPVRGLRTSIVQDMVPSVPVFGSFSENIASMIGELPCSAISENSSPERPAASCSMRQRTICANAETSDGMRFVSPSGGKGMSKASPPALARSLARMSIDSVLASAPRPRGCSLPLTHTSKAWEWPFSMWLTNTAKRDCGCSIM